jgi:hypothetical protein
MIQTAEMTKIAETKTPMIITTAATTATMAKTAGASTSKMTTKTKLTIVQLQNK